MSDDRLQQYILAAGKDTAIQDVGLYEHPQQVYMLGATIGVCAVLADWIESDRIKDANMQNLRARDLQTINLMGAAIVERGCAVQMLTDMVDFFGDIPMASLGIEKFRTGGDLIRDAKEVIKKAELTECKHNAEFERIQTAAKRYETLRRLNARQFADLYAKNLETGTPFDELVDGITKEQSNEN